MSIVVKQSAHVQLDEKSSAALQAVLSRLEVQADHVKEVQVLANFSVDDEAIMHFDTPNIVQGLVVQVSKDYKLGPEDKIWFHPAIGRGRSVYELASAVTKTNLAQPLKGLADSIGSYTISKPDEFGCEHHAHRLVVDTSPNQLLAPVYDEWLRAGVTAGDVDTQWKRMKFDDTYSVPAKAQAMRATLAKSVDSNAKLLHSDTINNVLSDITSVYFTNHVVKRASPTEPVLVKSSALGGYRAYAGRDEKRHFYPASLGVKSSFYKWNDMASDNCARIERTCSWDGEMSFNTNVMRPPTIRPAQIRTMEDEYEITLRDTMVMRLAHFSKSDAIIDKLSPRDLVEASPTPAQMSTAKDFISAPIDMNHPVLQRLMSDITEIQEKFPNFQLFNPKFTQGERLKLPRSVVEHIA